MRIFKMLSAMSSVGHSKKNDDSRVRHEMGSNKHRPTVAIVDDDASMCRAMQRLMWSRGIAAYTFASGQEFLDLLKAWPSIELDCVILDMQMPGLNGLQVQEYLTCQRPDIPVIFVTATHEARIREQALASGAVAFFAKPLNDDLLFNSLQAVLKIDAAGEP
jgi:FixJ family two-component response regulator